MRLKYFVWLGLGLYALLSATDWVFTFAARPCGHPVRVEANPVAAACLERYGWAGLAIFKAAGVLVFVAAVLTILRRRPSVATVVTTGACAVLLSVVVYTHGLLCESHRDAVERARDAAWPKPKDRPADVEPGRCWFAPDAPSAPATVAARK